MTPKCLVLVLISLLKISLFSFQIVTCHTKHILILPPYVHSCRSYCNAKAKLHVHVHIYLTITSEDVKTLYIVPATVIFVLKIFRVVWPKYPSQIFHGLQVQQ